MFPFVVAVVGVGGVVVVFSFQFSVVVVVVIIGVFCFSVHCSLALKKWWSKLDPHLGPLISCGFR